MNPNRSIRNFEMIEQLQVVRSARDAQAEGVSFFNRSFDYPSCSMRTLLPPAVLEVAPGGACPCLSGGSLPLGATTAWHQPRRPGLVTLGSEIGERSSTDLPRNVGEDLVQEMLF